jgi:hypothetical protein
MLCVGFLGMAGWPEGAWKSGLQRLSTPSRAHTPLLPDILPLGLMARSLVQCLVAVVGVRGFVRPASLPRGARLLKPQGRPSSPSQAIEGQAWRFETGSRGYHAG